ncbi:dedicator of cytokinesis protein 1 isoform X2 [Leptidea sinapis]|uniref:dedicator of cytokinesis protein 1 isoform X2 n=1 Tax=Leptidea sinapis TaxID=189913 RepID=UPI0021C4A0D6|nr:dedicator of cytokinesis protein 1 isoform X2 [Leptidea sinapis]
MTVWRKLENQECYAIAVYNFSSTPPHLQLEVGELVHIERECRDWYWGRSLRKEACGAFPKNYVVIRQCHVERCGETVVASAGGSGVVHDIALTLREWLQHWKLLYTKNDERFKFMEVSMRALLELRGQAASGALPQDLLRRVARTAVFTIDKGNRTLGMELAVRTISGQLVDPLTTSTFKLNALHDEANSRIDKNMDTTPSSRPSSQMPTVRSYTVVVHIKNFVCRMSDTAELSLALHDSSGTKLTESVLLKWSPQLAMELFTAPSLVFTDLGSDIKKEKIFLVCHIVRIGSMEAHNDDHSNFCVRRSTVGGCTPVSPVAGFSEGAGLRRPFGVAISDVTQHLATDNSDKEIQLPFYPCEKDNMDSLLKKVISNRDLKEQKQTQGLWVYLQMVEGDLKQIRQENPHIVVGNTAFARKMGFPEVILPGDARNDLYVTICSGSFSRGGKSTDRNIELRARVVDKNGRLIPGVISAGAGVPLMNEYTSIVYYHEDKPRWQEVFKVCLNIEEFKEAHIVFLCRHRSSNEAKDRSERNFALAYLRLMQREGTTVPDAQHHLAVYKIDYKRSQTSEIETEASAACLGLPSRRDELPAGSERGLTRAPLSLVHRDTLTVATKLCSTKLTQREEILGVLKWSTHHAEGTLRDALSSLLRVPNDELVKFLQDILDALFSILTQVEEDCAEYSEKSYAVLVLDCLLLVISLVSDHKYQHFQPVLRVYIESSFCDALAYEKLISIMVWTIRSAENGEVASKRLLQCMKCLESLVRVLVRSRQLRAALATGRDGEPYCQQLQSLLEALVWLMRCGDHALTCQGSALKYLPHAIPHMITIYPDTKLSEYTVWALEALPLTRLSNQRLHALLELVRGPLGTNAAARARLLPHLAQTLKALLRAPAEVELCVETLGEVVSLLARDDVGPVDTDRGVLARALLPTVLKIAVAMIKDRGRDENIANDDPLIRKLICVLLDMVRQMSEEQYLTVMKSVDAEGSGKTDSLVGDALALMTSLLQRPVVRPHWADMLHVQHYVMLHALRLLARTLRENLLTIDESDTDAISTLHQTLQDWFETVGLVAASPPLQLENFPASRRQRAMMLYGDIRRSAASLLSEMWHGLEEHKRYFIPQLVGPFLEVSFLCDDEVRNTIIPLFFDMMLTEYRYTQETYGEGNLRSFENELIDKLDVLAEGGRGDAQWRARFVSLCGTACGALEVDAGLRIAGSTLVAAAARQLDALLQYRAAPPPHRMYLITSVLRFYEQIERPHMYIRYVHRLAAMHRASNHSAEAGLTLQLHAKLLEWSPAPLPPRLRHPTAPDAHHTHIDLKISLYEEVARLLEHGHQWELAVEVVKELVSVQQLQYSALAQLHDLLAALYRASLKETRLPTSYFRVRYLGKGFPPHLLNAKGFVYRGNECDMLHNFKERMLDEWPEAEVLLKLDEPGEDITESDGQYLQINAVTPLMADKFTHLLEKQVDDRIVQYYEHNNVNKFMYSRPVHRTEDVLNGSSDDLSAVNEFATRWLERTEIEISDTLPGILRWFPVISSRTYWVCPLEVAIETMTNSNRQLKRLIMDSKSPPVPLHPLTMRLQGILDSPVQGGLVNYERAFLSTTYEVRHPEHGPLLQQLRELIVEQVPLLKCGLEVHASRDPQKDMHAHLVTCFRRMQQHVQQRYGLRTSDLNESASESWEVQLRRSTIGAASPVSTSSTGTSLSARNSQGDSDLRSLHTSSRISDVSANESTPKSKFKLNSAINWTRNSSSGTLTPRHKKRSRKSEVSVQSSGSQWYTTATGNGLGSVNNAVTAAINAAFNNNVLNAGLEVSPLRELRQELVTERPLRAEVERRLSQRASFITTSEPASNRDSLGTTDSNQDDEEPPPLPLKQSHRSLDLDSENNNLEANALPTRYNYDQVISPRNSYLYQSRRRNTCDLPPTTEKAPTPPPKKRNQPNA